MHEQLLLFITPGKWRHNYGVNMLLLLGMYTISPGSIVACTSKCSTRSAHKSLLCSKCAQAATTMDNKRVGATQV